MQWYREMFVWLSVCCIGATAAGQELGLRPAPGLSLGRPTPIAPGASAGGANEPGPFQPSLPAPPIPPVRVGHPPRFAVARGVQTAQDEPKFLPKDIDSSAESKSFRSLPPALDSQLGRAALPVSGTPDQPRPIDINKDSKVIVAAEPPRIRTVTASNGAVATMQGGNPLVDDGGTSLIYPTFGGSTGFYARAEALLWWTRGMHLPPLVTTANATDVPELTRGALGFGTTQILYGNTTTSAGPSGGGRFTLGYDLDPCGLCAVEGTFFFLGRKNDNHAFDSSAYPVLARPFFNVNVGSQDREVTTSPGVAPGDQIVASGGIRVNTSSTLFGAEANVRSLLWCAWDYKITGLVGFRYVNLGDQLEISEQSLFQKAIPGSAQSVPINVGDQVTVFDRFHTRNQFFGGQIGIGADRQIDRWTLEGNVKIALGVTNQTVDIDGAQQIVSANGRTQNFAGGLYALSSNFGHHAQNRFSYVPEIGLKVGYDLTDNIRLFVGYDFLYWSSVLRPGDQVDQSLNVNLVPNSGGPFPATNQVRPTVPFATSSYWAQGVNAGILFRY